MFSKCTVRPYSGIRIRNTLEVLQQICARAVRLGLVATCLSNSTHDYAVDRQLVIPIH